MKLLKVFLLLLVLLMGMATLSSGTYCICKDGVGDTALQKVIDYACGAGADCSAILAKGACYNPNTLKDHCNYAANSYFQRKGQATGTCDFAGSASPSTSIPTQSSGCVYPSTPGSTSNPPPSAFTTPPGTLSPPITYTLGPSSYNSDTSNNAILLSITNLFVPLAIAATSILWFSGLRLIDFAGL